MSEPESTFFDSRKKSIWRFGVAWEGFVDELDV